MISPRLRVVHITETYPPRRHPISDQVAGLARRQGAAGHAVHVLVATPLEEAEPGKDRFRTSYTDAPGVRVHRLASRLALGLPVLARGRASIERALGLLRPDVVHLHLPGTSPFGYDGARVARVMDLPLVFTSYSAAPETFSKYTVRMAGWSSAPVATSGVTLPAALAAAETFGDDAGRLLPLGTDVAAWQTAGDRREPAPELRVLVHASEPVRRLTAAFTEAAASVGGRLRITAVGPYAKDIPEPDLMLGDAPAEVYPALAENHDVFVSAAALDRHVAGAAAAGLILIGAPGTLAADLLSESGAEDEAGIRPGGFLIAGSADLSHALIKLTESVTLRERMRESTLDHAASLADAPAHWPNIECAADELYALARTRVGEFYALSE